MTLRLGKVERLAKSLEIPAVVGHMVDNERPQEPMVHFRTGAGQEKNSSNLNIDPHTPGPVNIYRDSLIVL